MLGTALRHVLSERHELVCLDRHAFDIASDDWRHLSVDGFDYVLNAAGLINRRDAPDEHYYRVNAVFPHALSTLCALAGARLIHFSTDCVFDGRNGPFDEAAPTAAADLYGRTKALGEPLGALVIRTSIIGPESHNKYNLLCWTLAQRRINGFTNHFWNGVTTLELARMIARIIDEALFEPGIRHIYSEPLHKCDLVRLICETFGHDAQITPMPAPDMRDTRLCTVYPEFLARLDPHPLRQQIADLVAVSRPDGSWHGQLEYA